MILSYNKRKNGVSEKSNPDADLMTTEHGPRQAATVRNQRASRKASWVSGF